MINPDAIMELLEQNGQIYRWFVAYEPKWARIVWDFGSTDIDLVTLNELIQNGKIKQKESFIRPERSLWATRSVQGKVTHIWADPPFGYGCDIWVAAENQDIG